MLCKDPQSTILKVQTIAPWRKGNIEQEKLDQVIRCHHTQVINYKIFENEKSKCKLIKRHLLFSQRMPSAPNPRHCAVSLKVYLSVYFNPILPV